MPTQVDRQTRYRKTAKGTATRKRCFEEWSAKNRKHRNAYMREWNRNNKDRLKDILISRRYKSRYGFSRSAYDDLLAAQGGHCALCNRTPDAERYGKLCVDHDHETGKVRGLLCTPHNHALGVLGDDALGLLRALHYVTNKVT